MTESKVAGLRKEQFEIEKDGKAEDCPFMTGYISK